MKNCNIFALNHHIIIQDYTSYLTHVKKYSPATVIAYTKDIEQFGNYVETAFECDDILLSTHLMIRSWVFHMTKENVASARSINRKLSSLNGFYKYLLRKEVIKANPMKKVVTPKMSKKLPSFIIEREISDVVKEPIINKSAFIMLRNSIIIDLLYQTGMRRSELLNIKVSDVNASRMELRVIGKGKKERVIPIQQSLIDSVNKYQKSKEEEFGAVLDEWLIVSNKGVKMNPKSLYNIVKQYLGIVTSSDKKSPHVLRHSFATHLLNNGADINAIKEILGHANLSATEVYTHNSVERLIKIYKKAHPKARKE